MKSLSATAVLMGDNPVAVEDAIIVAAGIGSRMLPATAIIAKEVLPLVDVPSLYHLCWEAIHAGATRLHLVISESKTGLIAKLRSDDAYIEMLAKSRPDLPKIALQAIPDDVELHSHIQHHPLGMADAVHQALKHIEGAALVLLGDNLLMDVHPSSNDIGIANASTASKRLVEAFQRTNRPISGLRSVPDSQISKYGVVEMEGERVIAIIEKPVLSEAPSNKVLCGRYLFTGDACTLLQGKINVESHGELQSIALFHYWMSESGGFIGVDLDDCQWYDSGTPMAWLQAQIDHALRRDDMSVVLREWLEERLNL